MVGRAHRVRVRRQRRQRRARRGRRGERALNHQKEKEKEQKKKTAPLGPNLTPPPDFLGLRPSVRPLSR